MRRVVVCADDFLFRLFHASTGSEPWVFLVSDAGTRRALVRQGALARAGALADPALYRGPHLTPPAPVILSPPARRPRLPPSPAPILPAPPAVPALAPHAGPSPPAP